MSHCKNTISVNYVDKDSYRKRYTKLRVQTIHLVNTKLQEILPQTLVFDSTLNDLTHRVYDKGGSTMTTYKIDSINFSPLFLFYVMHIIW